MIVRLGLHYDWHRTPGAAPPGGDGGLAALVDHAAAAEAHGFDVVWVAERPGSPESLLPAALPVCAAILARTTRLHVGTGVLPLPLHPPLRVAEDSASLSALSAGRFELGVGLGADPAVARRFGLSEAPRVELLEEGLALIRQAWERAPLEHGGGHFAVSGVEVWPKPAEPAGPPIWIGAGAPAAQRRAAQLADGLLLAPGADPTPFLEAWQRAGRPLAEARIALPPIGLEEAAATPDPARLFGLVSRRGETALASIAAVGRLDLVFAATAPAEELAALAAPWLEGLAALVPGAARAEASNLQ